MNIFLKKITRSNGHKNLYLKKKCEITLCDQNKPSFLYSIEKRRGTVTITTFRSLLSTLLTLLIMTSFKQKEIIKLS